MKNFIGAALTVLAATCVPGASQAQSGYRITIDGYVTNITHGLGNYFDPFHAVVTISDAPVITSSYYHPEYLVDIASYRVPLSWTVSVGTISGTGSVSDAYVQIDNYIPPYRYGDDLYISAVNPDNSISFSGSETTGNAITSSDFSSLMRLNYFQSKSVSANITGIDYYHSITASAAVTSFVVEQFALPAVPEPSTWAMIILGMGAVGYAMRRRRRVTPRLAFDA